MSLSHNFQKFFTEEEAKDDYMQVFKTFQREDDEFFINTCMEQLDWHFKMEGNLTNHLFPRGIQIGNSKVLFRAEAYYNTLSTIYCHLHSEEEVKIILEEMKKIAGSLKMKGQNQIFLTQFQ